MLRISVAVACLCSSTIYDYYNRCQELRISKAVTRTCVTCDISMYIEKRSVANITRKDFGSEASEIHT